MASVHQISIFILVADLLIDIPTCKELLEKIERETEEIIGGIGGLVQVRPKL